MRFLVDEHISPKLVEWLRDGGHDALSASEVAAGDTDTKHVIRAAREARVILTEDRDFSTRVREAAAEGLALPVALVHFRLKGLGRAAKLERMREVLDAIAGSDVDGKVFVVEPTRVREGTLRPESES